MLSVDTMAFVDLIGNRLIAISSFDTPKLYVYELIIKMFPLTGFLSQDYLLDEYPVKIGTWVNC